MAESLGSSGGVSAGVRATVSGGRRRGDRLPHDLSTFVGREREVADVVGLVGRARLVTLTGPGGSGKTRLAIETARRTAKALQLEAQFVDLAPVTEPGLLVASIVAALAIRPEPSQTAEDALVQGLEGRRLLLVLDNLEQLLPEAAATLSRLAGEFPDLRLLTTSRAPLHVRGEQEYLVEPLVQPEAVALFRDRAHAVDSRFELTEQNRATVEEICQRLDSLPLAIELAAARSKVMTPGALLRRLASGGSLPASASVDAPARQRTLRDTIAWSFGLLSPLERTVFSRVCVFVGGFDAEAADAVAVDPADPDPIDVGSALDRLVDLSLVRGAPDLRGEPRYRLLETVREYGLTQLSDVDLDRIRRRHALFFMQELVDRADYGAAPSPVAIREDFDNVRAALSWAEANDESDIVASLGINAWVYFGIFGYREEAHRWLDAAERASPSAEPAVRAGLLLQLARHELAYVGNRKRAEDLLSQALVILQDAGDPIRTTRILEILSHIASDLGEHVKAAHRMQQAVSQARQLEDRVRRARFLAGLASSGTAAFSLTEMQALAEEALTEGRDLGDEPAIYDALTALGFVALAKGEFSAAADIFTELLERAAVLSWDSTMTACCLAIALRRLGELDASRSLILESLPNARKLGVTWLDLTALEAAADWLGAAGQHARAASSWATIDAVRGRTLDRTGGNDLGIFAVSRDRDRQALKPAIWHAATAAGSGMSLDEGMLLANHALEDVVLTHDNQRRGRPSRYELTPRERQVLALLAAGRTDGQIAEELFISKSTAAVHVANIKGKLGATSRVDIATTAIELGLVGPPPSVSD